MSPVMMEGWAERRCDGMEEFVQQDGLGSSKPTRLASSERARRRYDRRRTGSSSVSGCMEERRNLGAEGVARCASL